MLSTQIEIRPATPGDIPALLRLMQSLADFEDYLDGFAVDATALQQRAFGANAECQIFIASVNNQVMGYAVVLEIAFTYDLRPTMRLKELYVDASQRSAGLGKRLMQAVARWALQRGAGRLNWEVLRGNQRAEAFYQRLGGEPEQKWLSYGMTDMSLARLAGDI
jgi:GNAT superfamily N-acetyltransferase